MRSFENYLNEGNRFSVEVNFRTDMNELLDSFAKLLLSYVSAALKERSLHVKKVFDAPPFRIVVSNGNWVDGEWVYVVSYNHKLNSFILSKGFYNRDRDTVTVQDSQKLDQHSAADVFKKTFNAISELKNERPHHIGGLKGVKSQTGPKLGSMRPAQGLMNMGDIRPQGFDKVGM